MSGSAMFAPAFVVRFGRRCNNIVRRKKRKRRQNHNETWQVSDSLLPTALSSLVTYAVVLFLMFSLIGAKGETISTSYVNNVTQIPTFNLTDLKNLVELFPEYREYVVKVISGHIERQQQQQQIHKRNDYAVSTTAITPVQSTDFQNEGPSRPEERKGVLFKNNFLPVTKDATSVSKLDYGWPPYEDDYFPQHHHNSKGYGYLYSPPSKGHGWGYESHITKGYGYSPPSVSHGWGDHSHSLKGYGYGYSPPSASHGWGWDSSDDEHKDPKFHYQVGYNIGKDVSCVLSLLGFKSFKDFTLHNIFGFFKKLKYLVLIGLAFKLGVILSPITLPMLFPFIILAVIAKLIPMLLIILLLFKLLKTQLKFGIGKRTGEIGDGGSISATSLLDGTNISNLWKSIDDTTQAVAESESCVEKIICQLIKKRANLRNSTDSFSSQEENSSEFETGRSFVSNIFNRIGLKSNVLERMLGWMYPSRKWSLDGGDSSGIWECDKIKCS